MLVKVATGHYIVNTIVTDGLMAQGTSAPIMTLTWRLISGNLEARDLLVWPGWILHWRHNDHDSVSNHQPHCCLLNRLFRRRSKKTSKFRVTGLCVGNSPGPVNSRTRGQLHGKCFHLMTSSWMIQMYMYQPNAPLGDWWRTHTHTPWHLCWISLNTCVSFY